MREIRVAVMTVHRNVGDIAGDFQHQGLRPVIEAVGERRKGLCNAVAFLASEP